MFINCFCSPSNPSNLFAHVTNNMYKNLVFIFVSSSFGYSTANILQTTSREGLH